VTLKITVRQNISQLFDDLDDGQADMLAPNVLLFMVAKVIGELMVLMRSSPRAIIPATRFSGVTLKITVRQNISQLFDDLDDGQADMLAAGLVYNQE
jgi:membrane-bound lytic murein transglycosylase MltF